MEREAAGKDLMDIIVAEGSLSQNLYHVLETFSLVIKVSIITDFFIGTYFVTEIK